MSLGLRKFKGFEFAIFPIRSVEKRRAFAVRPSNGIPSTTYKGLAPERIELLPRIFTVASPPG